MIFHYALCKQCNPSELPITMIDCALSHKESDMSGKKEKFLRTKRGTFTLPQKVVINVFLLGNPTPLANEGGIYHLCRGCHEDSAASAWELFSLSSVIVDEM